MVQMVMMIFSTVPFMSSEQRNHCQQLLWATYFLKELEEALSVHSVFLKLVLIKHFNDNNNNNNNNNNHNNHNHN